jgi:hypothetical protein
LPDQTSTVHVPVELENVASVCGCDGYLFSQSATFGSARKISIARWAVSFGFFSTPTVEVGREVVAGVVAACAVGTSASAASSAGIRTLRGETTRACCRRS